MKFVEANIQLKGKTKWELRDSSVEVGILLLKDPFERESLFIQVNHTASSTRIVAAATS